MSKQFIVIIPARMDSTRLPHKMLLEIDHMPLIIHTANQAIKSKAYRVIVATDHKDILNACKAHNIDAIMTKETHNSGTDRLAEVSALLGLASDEIVINVQGDEPLINPLLIDALAEFIIGKNSMLATIAHPIIDEDEIFNPNVVKVVLDRIDNALYFSRAPIPYYRDGFISRNEFKLPQNINILRHIGIYAYSVKFLQEYSKIQPCPLEQVESLEQLRALYNGYSISVLTTTIIPEVGVDTIEDLQRVRQIITNKKS